MACRISSSPFFVAAIVSLLVIVAGCSPAVVTPQNAKERLVFQVGSQDSTADEQTLEKAYEVIRRRVLSTYDFEREVLVEKRSPNQIVLSIRNLPPDKVDSLRRIVTRPGGLQFAILANRVDHAALIAAAEKSVALEEDAETAWFPVAMDDRGRPRDLYDNGSLAVRQTETNGRVFEVVLVVPGRPKMRITEEHLKRASPGMNESGKVSINFELTDRGAYLMQDLTTRNQPEPSGFHRKLGIILEGSVHTAPTLNAPIGAHGQIVGDFTEQDVDELVIALNGGRLPVAVRFVESQMVGGKE